MRLLVPLTLSLVAGCARSASRPDPLRPPAPVVAASPSASQPAEAAPFALVELFTSEGCDSCPSAESVASKLSHEPSVYVLTWHVDYWDYLGWKDPYSRKSWSDRQRLLAKFLGTGLYTPQLVVDGRAEMLGSHAAAVDDAVKTALAAKRTVAVRGHLREEKGVLFLAVDAPAPEGTVRAVLVEDGLASRPTKGENAGKLLRHDGVVRAAASAPVGPSPVELALPLPLDGQRARLAVVAWIASPSEAVVGAARFPLSGVADGT